MDLQLSLAQSERDSVRVPGRCTIQNLGPGDLYVGGAGVDQTTGTKVSMGETLGLSGITKVWAYAHLGACSVRLLDAVGTAPILESVNDLVGAAIEAYAPGVELGYAERTATFSTAATGLITTLSIPIIGNGRPVDVEFYCPRVWNATTANTYISGRIFRDGVQATDGGVFSPVTSAGPSLYVKHAEPIVPVGVAHTFTVQAFLGSAGTHNFYASAASKCYLKAVTR